jgi:hypothetical protein
MDYLNWNDKIAARFFTSEMKDRRVYLYVTNEVIREVGKAGDKEIADFVGAVKSGPPWVSHGGICDRAGQTLAGWRRRKLRYPPYVGYLAFFVLAAGSGRGHEFAPQAYYPRLRKLLGEHPVAGTYPGFGEMRALWDDLESWSQRDQGGNLGMFKAQVTNRFIHVGIPISQTILTELERQALPAIFADAALDPTSAPSELLFSELLTRYGRTGLRGTTLRILERRGSHEEAFEVLIDAALQQLAEWDGTVVRNKDEHRQTSVFGTARLWCEEPDEVSGTADMSLICRTRHEFPEDGLTLKLTGCSEQYVCKEFREGWSTPLHSEDGNVFDAASLDWCSGVRLREVNRGWRFSLITSPVRLLMSGATEGLAGYVEAQRLIPETPLLVLSRHDCNELIEEWGQRDCIGFTRLGIHYGLPVGWKLYSVESVVDDALVRDAFPILSFPQTVQISFKGGITSSANTYFSFSLPDIIVSGAKPAAELFCNDRFLGTCATSVFHLPPDLIGDTKLLFEVKSGKQAISRRALYVQKGIGWPQTVVSSWSDKFGSVVDGDVTSRAAGALVISPHAFEFGGWIESSLLPGRTEIGFSPDALPQEATPELPEARPVSGLAPFPVASTEAEMRTLLSHWRNEALSGVADSSAGAINTRDCGKELTEGFLQYLDGSRRGGRSWLRAIRELSLASRSADETIRTVGSALLQLAFYKSGRLDKAAELANTAVPQPFGRLGSFMKSFENGALLGKVPLDGIGITDISPLAEDAEIEQKSLGIVVVNGGSIN